MNCKGEGWRVGDRVGGKLALNAMIPHSNDPNRKSSKGNLAGNQDLEVPGQWEALDLYLKGVSFLWEQKLALAV